MALMVWQLDSLIDGPSVVDVSPCAKSLPPRLLLLSSPYANPCFKLGFISRTVPPTYLVLFDLPDSNDGYSVTIYYDKTSSHGFMICLPVPSDS